MLDLRWIRENYLLLKKANKERGVKIDLAKLLDLDERRRQMLTEVENLRNLRNTVSQEIGRLNKDKLDSSAKVAEMQEVGRKIKTGEVMVREITLELETISLYQPNMPLEKYRWAKGRKIIWSSAPGGNHRSLISLPSRIGNWERIWVLWIFPQRPEWPVPAFAL